MCNHPGFILTMLRSNCLKSLKKTWHNILLLAKLLLLAHLIQLLQLDAVEANPVQPRDSETQKNLFFIDEKTNAACVDNFVRLWQEEMSAEERAHWDDIEGLKMEHIDKFIDNNFKFEFKKEDIKKEHGNVIMATHLRLPNETDPLYEWSFHLYLFKGFSFYFSPTGQISPRDLAKIAFILSWQRMRLVDKRMDWHFIRDDYGFTPNVYMCKVLDAALRMPTSEELKAETELLRQVQQQQQQMQRHQVQGIYAPQYPQQMHQALSGQNNNKKSQEQPDDIRARFQKFFANMHSNDKIEKHRRTKLEAILSYKINGKFDYWNQICPVDGKPDVVMSSAFAKFIKHAVGEDNQPPTGISGYIMMYNKFVTDEWAIVQQKVYKYMEVYAGRQLTSFNPYELSELPVLLFMCLFKMNTGELRLRKLLKLLEQSEGKHDIYGKEKLAKTDAKILMSKYGLSLKLTLDAWEPEWLLKKSKESGTYPPTELPLERVLNVDYNHHIFMPIDAMDAEHIGFLLKTHENSAEWKCADIKPAPIKGIEQIRIEEIVEFDILAFTNQEGNNLMITTMIGDENLLEYSNSHEYGHQHHLTFWEWVSRSYQLFRLQQKGGSSAEAEVQRHEFAIQIYLRLFRTFVKIMRESGERGKHQSLIPEEEHHLRIASENAAKIGRKLVKLLIAKREAEQQLVDSARKEPINICATSASSVTWIDGILHAYFTKNQQQEIIKPSIVASHLTPSSGRHVTTASLLVEDTSCIEASTQWVRRLLAFDLMPAYRTSFAWKLLGLVSVQHQNYDRVNIGFGIEQLLNNQLKDVSVLSRMERELKAIYDTNIENKMWQWAEQQQLEPMLAQLLQQHAPVRVEPEWAKKLNERESRSAPEQAKKFTVSLGRTGVKFTNHLLTDIVGTEAAERIKTELNNVTGTNTADLANKFNEVMSTSNKIERLQYQLGALDLLRLFAFVQLGALVSVNHIVAEKLWADLMNGTRTLEETKFNTERVLDYRDRLIGNLRALHAYISKQHQHNGPYQTIIPVVGGLQPSVVAAFGMQSTDVVIRPQQQQWHESDASGHSHHQQQQAQAHWPNATAGHSTYQQQQQQHHVPGWQKQEGKSVFALAKMSVNHEAVRKQMTKHDGLKAVAKMVARKRGKQRKRQKPGGGKHKKHKKHGHGHSGSSESSEEEEEEYYGEEGETFDFSDAFYDILDIENPFPDFGNNKLDVPAVASAVAENFGFENPLGDVSMPSAPFTTNLHHGSGNLLNTVSEVYHEAQDHDFGADNNVSSMLGNVLGSHNNDNSNNSGDNNEGLIGSMINNVSSTLGNVLHNDGNNNNNGGNTGGLFGPMVDSVLSSNNNGGGGGGNGGSSGGGDSSSSWLPSFTSGGGSSSDWPSSGSGGGGGGDSSWFGGGGGGSDD